jgi:hypothetical protein
MLVNRASIWLTLLAIMPSCAFAHGEEVLLFPIGTLVAVVTLLLIASLRAARWHIRIVATLFAFVASIPFWFVPGNLFPAALRYTGWGDFIVGFLPSFTTGGLALLFFVRSGSARSEAQLINQADR